MKLQKKLTNRISQITLPSVYNHHVHCYLLEFNTYYVLIDCGENNDETKVFWEQFSMSLSKPITHLIITHIHTDHSGCCQFLKKQMPLRIIAPAISKRKLQTMQLDTTNYGLINSAARYGIVYPYKHKQLLDEAEAYDFKIDETIEDGQFIHFDDYTLQAIATPGHAIDQFSFYAESDQLLYASDHLIADFSPVLIIEETFQNPLQSYLTSLDKITSLPMSLGLSGHGALITQPEELIKALKSRHFKKLQTIQQYLQQQAYTAAELLYLLYKKDTTKSSSQFMQLLSYLNYLLAENTIRHNGSLLSAH